MERKKKVNKKFFLFFNKKKLKTKDGNYRKKQQFSKLLLP